ncbi:sodium- and chloride-dependent GABA transporter 1-like protein [Dinothrombium tinctorium]|uniref:Sodium-and chloride-dependent GABA transporter 1-like protein n=1 Tax=Dinothrombium tinctorium TaxID=1965070 RepID=A0A443RPM9_9ACAR|nr:sodium- and chloride-dependent GABA transporter 1-like protein [Dinothrombium tinctorium]
MLFFAGINRYYNNLKDMLGYEPCIWWKISWVYRNLTYMNYVYPWWGELIGWCLALSSMLCIPGYAIYLYLVTPGPFDQKMKALFRPDLPNLENECRQRALKEQGLTTVTPV